MQNAGHQYGQGAASAHQTSPYLPSEPSLNGGTTTSSLRQFRKKDVEKQSSDQTSTVSEAHVARVAPHNHYPPKNNDFYRYSQQFQDYSLPPQVKYSEIADPQQNHQLTSVIQKTKSKEFMDMCNIQQPPHMKQAYPDHLAGGQQGYQDNAVHAQYLHKDSQQVHHPSYKPESQYFSKDQYQQLPHQLPKCNTMPSQIRKYQPESAFLSRLSRIHPTMARSIMSDHHLQEAQQSYPTMDPRGMYPAQNQRYYPGSLQSNHYSSNNYSMAPHYQNYPASCNYPRSSQMGGVPRFTMNPHMDEGLSPRRSYPENVALPYSAMGQKMSSNYPQYAPEYAQHYQHRRANINQDYYQQHRQGPYMQSHQISASELNESRVSPSDNLKKFIENWGTDEETSTDLNPMENNLTAKDNLRVRPDESTETLYVLNPSELQYFENNGITVTSENCQYIIKSGVSIDNSTSLLRIIENNKDNNSTGVENNERIVNVHIMDPSKPDCMMANHRYTQQQSKQSTDKNADHRKVVIHQNTILQPGHNVPSKDNGQNRASSEAFHQTKVKENFVQDVVENMSAAAIFTDKQLVDKNCSPINIEQFEKNAENDIKEDDNSDSDEIKNEKSPPRNMPFIETFPVQSEENSDRIKVENTEDSPNYENTVMEHRNNSEEAIDDVKSEDQDACNDLEQFNNNTSEENPNEKEDCITSVQIDNSIDLNVPSNGIYENNRRDPNQNITDSKDEIQSEINEQVYDAVEKDKECPINLSKIPIEDNKNSNTEDTQNSRNSCFVKPKDEIVETNNQNRESFVENLDKQIVITEDGNKGHLEPSSGTPAKNINEEKQSLVIKKRKNRIFSVDDIMNNIGHKQKTSGNNLEEIASLELTETKSFLDKEVEFSSITMESEKVQNTEKRTNVLEHVDEEINFYPISKDPKENIVMDTSTETKKTDVLQKEAKRNSNITTENSIEDKCQIKSSSKIEDSLENTIPISSDAITENMKLTDNLTDEKISTQSEVQYRNAIRIEESTVLLQIAGELVEINVNTVNGKKVITVTPLSESTVVDFNDNYETMSIESPNQTEDVSSCLEDGHETLEELQTMEEKEILIEPVVDDKKIVEELTALLEQETVTILPLEPTNEIVIDEEVSIEIPIEVAGATISDDGAKESVTTSNEIALVENSNKHLRKEENLTSEFHDKNADNMRDTLTKNEPNTTESAKINNKNKECVLELVLYKPEDSIDEINPALSKISSRNEDEIEYNVQETPPKIELSKTKNSSTEIHANEANLVETVFHETEDKTNSTISKLEKSEGDAVKEIANRESDFKLYAKSTFRNTICTNVVAVATSSEEPFEKPLTICTKAAMKSYESDLQIPAVTTSEDVNKKTIKKVRFNQNDTVTSSKERSRSRKKLKKKSKKSKEEKLKRHSIQKCRVVLERVETTKGQKGLLEKSVDNIKVYQSKLKIEEEKDDHDEYVDFKELLKARKLRKMKKLQQIKQEQINKDSDVKKIEEGGTSSDNIFKKIEKKHNDKPKEPSFIVVTKQNERNTEKVKSEKTKPELNNSENKLERHRKERQTDKSRTHKSTLQKPKIQKITTPKSEVNKIVISLPINTDSKSEITNKDSPDIVLEKRELVTKIADEHVKKSEDKIPKVCIPIISDNGNNVEIVVKKIEVASMSMSTLIDAKPGTNCKDFSKNKEENPSEPSINLTIKLNTNSPKQNSAEIISKDPRMKGLSEIALDAEIREANKKKKLSLQEYNNRKRKISVIESKNTDHSEEKKLATDSNIVTTEEIKTNNLQTLKKENVKDNTDKIMENKKKDFPKLEEFKDINDIKDDEIVDTDEGKVHKNKVIVNKEIKLNDIKAVPETYVEPKIKEKHVKTEELKLDVEITVKETKENIEVKKDELKNENEICKYNGSILDNKKSIKISDFKKNMINLTSPRIKSKRSRSLDDLIESTRKDNSKRKMSCDEFITTDLKDIKNIENRLNCISADTILQKKEESKTKCLDDLETKTETENTQKNKLNCKEPTKNIFSDWEETQSPKSSDPKSSTECLKTFSGLIKNSNPKVVIDFNDLQVKSSNSEDETLQAYKEQVDSKLNSLNINIPRTAKTPPALANLSYRFTKPESNNLVQRFLNNEKISAKEIQKIKEIITYKKMVQLNMKKTVESSYSPATPSQSYEVRKTCDDEDMKLHLKKVPLKRKKVKFRSNSEESVASDLSERNTNLGDYSVVQYNALENGVPKLIIKRKTEMPQPVVRLERLNMDLLNKKRKIY